MKRFLLAILLCVFVVSSLLPPAQSIDAATLFVGVARNDMTPSKSVPLHGQFHLRLSQGVETPLTVHVVALESVDGEKRLDSVIFVSADLAVISDDLFLAVRNKVAEKDVSIDVNKLVVSATHTHNAPTLKLDSPKLTASNVTLEAQDEIMDYPEAIDFVAERIADAVAGAWKNRKPGKIAFGLDFGVVGWNRRTVYADGHAVMLGNTNRPDFRGMEAVEDHDIGSVFFLDENDRLSAVAVNVASPAQIAGGYHTVTEQFRYINADFWHPVREKLTERFGNDLVVLGWCGAAGDICPYPMYQRTTMERMRTLRGLDEMQDIARKIDRAVADTWDAVRTTARADVPLVHRMETLQLPMRQVTEQEYAEAKAECEKIDAALKANPDKAPAEIDWMAGGWHGGVVKRYEARQKDPEVRFPATIHVLRLGDAAIFTNPFELFTDYGIQMKARSPAVQTFVVQLTGSVLEVGGYLPTEKAVRGGSYSAIIQSTPVGPEGGQMLVEETLWQAYPLFPKE